MTAETAEVEKPRKRATAKKDEPKRDLEPIVGSSDGTFELIGVTCSVRRIKVLEFFQIAGIITNGLGPGLANIPFADAEDMEAFGGMLAATFLLAIPNQGEQFMKFVRDVVEPHGPKADQQEVHRYLENPELEDLLPIVDAIIENEKEHIWDLVGKFRAYLVKWQTTFQGLQAAR